MAEVSSNEQLHASSFLQGHNAEYVEQLHARYVTDAASVDPSWQAYFASLGDDVSDVVSEAAGAPWERADWPPSPNDELTHALDGNWDAPPDPERLEKKIRENTNGASASNGALMPVAMDESGVRAAVLDSVRAIMYIRSFRSRGHLGADLDPLGLQGNKNHPEFDPKFFGFSDADLDRPIFIDNVLGLETASIREIEAILKRTYQGTFALQFMHLQSPEPKSWLQQRIEGLGKEIAFTDEGRKAIFGKMVEAEGFEKFLHVKYMGTKRFGLDGGESLIPAMEQIIKRGGAMGAKEIVFGMPHRGRLNILANVMSKPYRAIFNEFQGGSFKPEDVDGSGDVKYHLGTSSDREFNGNKVHLSLTANPSHLEAVNPVVLGKVRAKQAHFGDDRTSVIPVLLHGDAAFAGQGVIAECFGLSDLKGHKTGGTIHIIVNNQIGFTTAPHHSRSSPYPTDIAKMVDCPIFHVNGDDPEAVVHAAKVATEFRQLFQRDVVIDIFCYRRFGHNEGDEP
ncbi:MAG: thiamine pyrophosphate-dependent enzyme, partial [Paracoccaceae bacterium]